MQNLLLNAHSPGDEVIFHLFLFAVCIAVIYFVGSNLARDRRLNLATWEHTKRSAEASERHAKMIHKTSTYVRYISIPYSVQINIPHMTEIELEYFIIRSVWAHYGERAENYRFGISKHKNLIRQIDEAQAFTTNEIANV